MTAQPDAFQRNGLIYLRIFLLVCFLSVSFVCSVILAAPLLMLNFSGNNPTIKIFNIPLPDLNLPLPTLAFLTILVLISFTGVACIGIYFILTSRIQKEAGSYPEGDNDETAD